MLAFLTKLKSTTEKMNRSTKALKLFEILADSVWWWLGEARRLNLPFSEDTITDLTAFEITRHLSNIVTVGRISKREERRKGFDWMWVIQRPAGREDLYFVQAKKMKLTQRKTYSYGNLRYRGRKGCKYQIDALEDCAHEKGAIPLYCFYNNVDESIAQQHWNCRQQPEPVEVSQMGCTLVPLDAVRPIHDIRYGRKNFSSIHKDQPAFPWRCLFHPQCLESHLLGSEGYPSPETNQSVNRVKRLLNSQASKDSSIGEYFQMRKSSVVDIDEVIEILGLKKLMEKYENESFLPIPERFLILNLQGGSTA